MPLPEPFDTVVVQHGVVAEDWHLLDQRMSDQQPVERVGVVKGQAREDVEVLWRHRR